MLSGPPAGIVLGAAMAKCSGAATVRTVEPIMLPSFAEIVDVPVAAAVATPVALIVATVVVADVQVTFLDRSCVELSLKVPVATNCRVWPLATLGLAGVTAIESNCTAA